jgi:hypothetical protein
MIEFIQLTLLVVSGGLGLGLLILVQWVRKPAVNQGPGQANAARQR